MIDRHGQFQVEQFIVNGSFPIEHRHPHVDSFEMHFCNEIPLTVNGKPAKMKPMRRHSDPNGPVLYVCRVRSTDWHGAEVKVGSAFFSVQRWADGVSPSSVGLDWEGSPVSMQHAAQLRGLE